MQWIQTQARSTVLRLAAPMVMASFLACAEAEESARRPLLIEFGQSTPDVRLMRKYVNHWEQYLPFDGVVLSVNQQRHAGHYGSVETVELPLDHWALGWIILTHQRADPTAFEYAIEDLRATTFTKFKHNFLKITCKDSYEFDWFAPELWQTVLHNVKLHARIAKQGGCEGLFFDPEHYGSKYWTHVALQGAFPNRPQGLQHYADIVRKKGIQFIQAINSEFPDCQFLLLFGSTFPFSYQTEPHTLNRPADMNLNGPYGLLPPFIDGLLFGADRRTTIIDGCELSYYYKTARRFAQAREVIRHTCRDYSSIPEFYSKNIHVGFGIFPARQSHGFDPHDLTKGDYTPQELSDAVRAAMNITDRYVWIWNEAATFWVQGGPEGKPLLPDTPHIYSGEFGQEATVENALSKKFYGMPQGMIEALAHGKVQAREDVRRLRVPDWD